MSDVPVITVITLTEWALLFVNGDLVDSNDEISLRCVERASKNEAFKLVTIKGERTKLDDMITETGGTPVGMKLEDAVRMTIRNRAAR